VLFPFSGFLLTLTGFRPLCPLPWITTTCLATRLHNLSSQSAPPNPEDGHGIFLGNLNIRLQDHAVSHPRRAWFGCASGLAAEVGICWAAFGGQGLVEVVSVVSPVCARIYSLRDPLSARGCLYLARPSHLRGLTLQEGGVSLSNQTRGARLVPAALGSLFLVFMYFEPVWHSQSVTGLLAWRPEGRGSTKVSPFSTAYIPVLGPTQPPVLWVPSLFPRGKAAVA
jgi:hypothetical protein